MIANPGNGNLAREARRSVRWIEKVGFHKLAIEIASKATDLPASAAPGPALALMQPGDPPRFDGAFADGNPCSFGHWLGGGCPSRGASPLAAGFCACAFADLFVVGGCVPDRLGVRAGLSFAFGGRVEVWFGVWRSCRGAAASVVSGGEMGCRCGEFLRLRRRCRETAAD